MIEKLPVLGRTLRSATKAAAKVPLVRSHNVAGYQPFVILMAELERVHRKHKITKQPINVYFTGSLIPEIGENWCPTCVRSEPLVRAALKEVNYACDIVWCDVGDRACWEDRKNGFRTNRDTHLVQLPTLLRWKCEKRLEGNWMVKPELLQMFFENDE